MKKILKSSIAIITEISTLILSCFWYYKTCEIEPVICIIASSSLLISSLISFIIPDKKPKVGNREYKYLGRDFLYNYVPGEISINKIIEDFGQPTLRTTDAIEHEFNDSEVFEISLYKYIFQNAVILISTKKDNDTVISISLVSGFNKKYPVNCRYSFAEGDKIFGEATFSQNILNKLEKFNSESYTQWGYSSVVSRYADYKPIKYLYFAYWIYRHFNDPIELLDKEIAGTCISTISFVTPVIHFDDYVF